MSDFRETAPTDQIRWALELMQRPGGKVKAETLTHVITGRLRAVTTEGDRAILVIGDAEVDINDIITLTSES